MSKSGSSKISRLKKRQKRLKVIAVEKRVARSLLTPEQVKRRGFKTELEILETMIYDFNLNSLRRDRYPELKERTNDRISYLKVTHFKTEIEEKHRSVELIKLFELLKVIENREK